MPRHWRLCNPVAQFWDPLGVVAAFAAFSRSAPSCMHHVRADQTETPTLLGGLALMQIDVGSFRARLHACACMQQDPLCRVFSCGPGTAGSGIHSLTSRLVAVFAGDLKIFHSPAIHTHAGVIELP